MDSELLITSRNQLVEGNEYLIVFNNNDGTFIHSIDINQNEFNENYGGYYIFVKKESRKPNITISKKKEIEYFTFKNYKDEYLYLHYHQQLLYHKRPEKNPIETYFVTRVSVTTNVKPVNISVPFEYENNHITIENDYIFETSRIGCNLFMVTNEYVLK